MEQAVSRAVREPERRLTLVERNTTDRQARVLARLYEAQAVPLYRWIYQQVGNRADAEALTTRTFQTARQRLDPARAEVAQTTWLFGLAQEALTDHWQAQFPTRRQMVGGDLSRPALMAQLERLPPLYRQVLTLRLLNGCSLQETATALGCTPDEAKARQYDALQAVQRLEA